MENLSLDLIENLTSPGPRLPWIKEWLLNEIWSSGLYSQNGPLDFLKQGEESVNLFEQLTASAAGRVYGELLSNPDPAKRLLSVLSDPDTAVIIFDGLSLREIPMIVNLAKKSGFKLTHIDTSLAPAPSETMDYIEREFSCGKISPSQLPTRKELKEKGIVVLYSGNYCLPVSGEYKGLPLLVWSSFPDETYKDSGARFESHFANIHSLFETAWMNTAQQIKGKKKIIITSDHGYIFFGTGMDFPRSPQELAALNEYFGNNRNAPLNENPEPPLSDDVFCDPSRNIAMVRGRVKTRSTGTAATKLYKHGGLSLMEMLTPWIELETGY
ncbi:hypothetical protein [Desulfobacterium sp. N47]|uniref:PglZ domain-containing protein n=1 Tax=uncultured Desulfobacterium sp. TaxID=201089 RepID=E1YIH1_9BACT|nr:hypothetical protein N47_D28270 [uncultured Desulfobacterium sp.]